MANPFDTRLPPYDEASEKGVIGACIAEFKAGMYICHSLGITHESFYMPAHRSMFEVMLDMTRRGRPIDLYSLTTSLLEAGKMEACGGEEYIHALLENCTPAYIEHYASVVKENALKRVVITAARKAEQEAYDPEVSAETAAANSIAHFMEAASGMTVRQTPAEITTSLEEAFVHAREIGYSGFPSKWLAFQNFLGSYQRKDMTVLAGAPSDGKTASVLEEVINMCLTQKARVAIASLEMSEDSLRNRAICCHAGLSTFKFRIGQFSDDDLAKWRKSAKIINALPLYINDKRMTIGEIRVWFSFIKARYNIDVGVIDYLQLIKEDAHARGRSRNDIVGGWSSDVKGMTKHLDIHTFLLSQLSRRNHKDKTTSPPSPTMEALRDSGAIEQDADNVILIAKKPGLDMDVFSSDKDWAMMWDLAKSRNGPTGELPMYFVRKYGQYVDATTYELEIERENDKAAATNKFLDT